MTSKACLDTGIINLNYSKEVPLVIENIMNRIKKKDIEAYVVITNLAEAFYHICKLKGKSKAESVIASFLNDYPIKLVNLTQSLIIKAGLLKCQYRKDVSYNDCFAIAFALNNNIEFHTTEEELRQIIPNLKTKEYQF